MLIVILYLTAPQRIQTQILNKKDLLQFDDDTLVLHPSVYDIPHFVLTGIDVYQLAEIGCRIDQRISVTCLHPLVTVHNPHGCITVFFRLLHPVKLFVYCRTHQIGLHKIRIQTDTFGKIIVCTIPVLDFHFQQSAIEKYKDIVRIHFHHLVQVADGSVGLAHLCPQKRTVVVSINVITVYIYHFGIVCQSLRILFHLIPHHGAAHQNAFVFRIGFQGTVKILNGIVIILLLVMEISAQSVGIIGKHIQTDCRIAVGHGPFPLFQLFTHHGSVQISSQQLVVQHQCFGIVAFSLLIPAHGSLRHSSIGISIRRGRIERDSLIEILQGLLKTLHTAQCHPPIEIGMKIIGIQFQSLCKVRQSPFVVVQILLGKPPKKVRLRQIGFHPDNSVKILNSTHIVVKIDGILPHPQHTAGVPLSFDSHRCQQQKKYNYPDSIHQHSLISN